MPENLGPSSEIELAEKDITSEFLEMNTIEFADFLQAQKREPTLSIAINWDDNDKRLDENTLARLKNFLETAPEKGQKRSATVRATKSQKCGPTLGKSRCRNAFASGVKWEKIEE